MFKPLRMGLFVASIYFFINTANSSLGVLEAEIKNDYEKFQTLHHSIPGLSVQPCLAVQFVHYLRSNFDQKDTKVANKIMAITSTGLGVGGIAKRQATEDEQKILLGAVYTIASTAESALIQDLKVDEFTADDVLNSHQQMVHSVYRVAQKGDLQFRSTDFLQDTDSYKVLTQSVASFMETYPRYNFIYQEWLRTMKEGADILDGWIRKRTVEVQWWIIGKATNLLDIAQKDSHSIEVALRMLLNMSKTLEQRTLIDQNWQLLKEVMNHPKLQDPDPKLRLQAAARGFYLPHSLNICLIEGLPELATKLEGNFKLIIESLLRVIDFSLRLSLEEGYNLILKTLNIFQEIDSSSLQAYLDQIFRLYKPDTQYVTQICEEIKSLKLIPLKDVEHFVSQTLKIFPPDVPERVDQGSNHRDFISYINLRKYCDGYIAYFTHYFKKHSIDEVERCIDLAFKLIVLNDPQSVRQAKFEAVISISAKERENFIDFIVKNHVEDIEIICKLSATPAPQDWPEALKKLQQKA